VVLAVFVAAGVVATTHTTDKGKASTQRATTNPVDNPDLPVMYETAKKEGKVGDYDWDPGCDKTSGRLALPTVYAPPCVPVHTGPNGGATAPGVTADTINVVLYQAPPTDLTAALQANTDPPEAQWATAQDFAAEFNHLFQMSGRKVKLIRFQSNGISTDDTTARADAIKVADDLHAFASIGGPAQTAAYEDELAARGVLCLGCGLSVGDADFQRDAPHMWGTLATPDQLLESVFDYVVQRLYGRKASFAGDPAFRKETRKFGTVSYTQDPPVPSATALRDKLNKQYAKAGIRQGVNETYLLDLAKLPETATTIVGHLKAKGVTTVVFVGDPIMPIYLTKAATAQHYFPEWIVTGTVLTDTSALARLYDQEQWAHAFGVSSLAVPVPQHQSTAWRLYTWYYGHDPAAPKTVGVIYPSLFQLFTGIHLAGPHLTDLTFQGGLFRYPPSGGGPTNPRISYGNHGLFPAPDYVGVDDTTEIWWDANVTAEDEQGKVAKGHYRYANGGRRYLPGQIPKRPSDAFKRAGSVVEYDDPTKLPASDRIPDVPPWPGSPAAGG
jgi:hypothetical protein